MAAGMMRLVTKARNQPYRKKGRKRVPKASKALKKVIQKEIRKDQEKKYIDNVLSATGGAAPYLLDATAEVIPTSLTGASAQPYGMVRSIIQGTDQQTRIGDEIRVTNMSLKFRATSFSSTATGVVYIVRFPQSNGTVPNTSVPLIWSNITDIAVSHRDVDHMNDYHILGRIFIQATAGTSLNRMYEWSKSYKGTGLKVEFDGSTSDYSDVEFNNVFLVAQSNGSDDVISITNGVFRLSYTDS